MALPSTGNPISFNQIRIELGFPNQPSFDIRNAELGNYSPIQNCAPPRPNAATPSSLSEWWSYAHNQTGSFFAEGKTGGDCSSICNGAVSCNETIYTYGGTYYAGNNRCNPGTTANTYFIAPTACSGGTFENQTCYEFVNGTISSTETCTFCFPNGDPCPPNPEDCCSGGCCNGYCDPNPC
jgi:hypothetical protein